MSNPQDFQHEVYQIILGDSQKNKKYPRNVQRATLRSYINLLWTVLKTELTTFYTLYFVLLGILEAVPECSTSESSLTFLPIIVYIGMEYFVQAYDYYKAQKALKYTYTQFTVYRNKRLAMVSASDLIPGDIVQIKNDKTPIPADSILLTSNQYNVFINTSQIDGETELKDRYCVRLPPEYTAEKISQHDGTVTATHPKNQSQEVSGSITIVTETNTDAEILDQSDNSDGSSGSTNTSGGRFIIANGSINTPFEANNFIERGSIIESDGEHYVLVLYTGTDCRSDTSIKTTAPRRTLIDSYLEKLSVFVFCFQFLIGLILGVIGYNISLKPHYTFISPIIAPKGMPCFIFITRNFCLLSFMIPITLKLILPIFRFIYGIFIRNDINFVDPQNDIHAEALNTNLTENLGAVDVIVADKTGTLTKNQLKLISFSVGNAKYGDNAASTIYEDEDLKRDFQQSESEIFHYMLRAMSVCHSVRINEAQDLFGSNADDIAIVTALKNLGWTFDCTVPNTISVESPIGNYSYKILRVNPFNSKRKRMSVVVQEGNRVFCFMKGAPDCLADPFITSFSGNMAAEYLSYQASGYRSLAVSYKEINNYSESMKTKQLESDHQLLGSLGIEDELQNDVQLTIDVLQNADIKMWVATGDARPNTIVTCSMLKLLRRNEQIVHLEKGNLSAEIADFLHRPHDLHDFSGFSTAAFRVPENSFSTVIDSSNSSLLKKALEIPQFVNALLRGRSVIFYRCKPTTKADVVVALQNNKMRVLAVGDGANDSLLLRSADVGIGIIGKQGTRSFATCDFAIPSFRDLCHLILIHGHISLHRSVLCVHFSFYKAVLFALCQAIYQYWTGFTGQSFFDTFSLTTFNVLWTLFPILAVIFEKDISQNFLFKLSSLYKQLRNPLSLHPSNLNWFYVAIYQAFVTMAITFLLTGEAFLNPKTGTDYGSGYLSLVVYFSLVMICSFYMIYQLNTFTYFSLVLICGNILILIAVSGLIQSDVFRLGSDGRNWNGFFGECLNYYQVLIMMLTIFLAAVIPSWIGLTIWAEIRSPEALIAIEKETIAAKNDQPLFFDPPKNY